MLPLIPTAESDFPVRFQSFWTRPSAQNRLRSPQAESVLLQGTFQICDKEVSGKRFLMLCADSLCYSTVLFTQSSSDTRIRGYSGLFDMTVSPFEEILDGVRTIGARLTRCELHVLDIHFHDEATMEQWVAKLQQTCTRRGLRDRYRLVHKIAAGHFGTVFSAEEIDTGRVFAIKAVAKAQKSSVDSEIEALNSIQSPAVVKLVEVCEDEKMVYLVMEKAAGVDLETIWRRSGPMEEELVREIVEATLKALEDMHAQGFVHRDIKPANIMVDIHPSGHLRTLTLIDFGLAATMSSLPDSCCGTLGYLAPEMITTSRASEKTDIFSLGATMYGLIAGEGPFTREDETKSMRLNARGSVKFREREWRRMSKECVQVVEALMCLDQTKRPSAREALLLPWFSSSSAKLTHEISQMSMSSKDTTCSEI